MKHQGTDGSANSINDIATNLLGSIVQILTEQHNIGELALPFIFVELQKVREKSYHLLVESLIFTTYAAYNFYDFVIKMNFSHLRQKRNEMPESLLESWLIIYATAIDNFPHSLNRFHDIQSMSFLSLMIQLYVSMDVIA
jgi:hypothetical protein